jgi:signal transduction histidine kinase
VDRAVIFRKAVRRLTVSYSLIQLVLFALTALAIYLFVALTFDFDVARADGSAASFDAAGHALSKLRTALVVVYLGLLVVVPLVSYLMARVALRPLRLSYERQQQFVDAASHEFRTPLGVIMGELSLALMRPRKGDEYRAAIEQSLAAAEGMASLTNQLLLLSRDDLSERDDDQELIAVDEVLAAALGMSDASEASAPTVVAVPAPGVTVRGSRDLLVHAVRNIVDNSIKYTEPAGRVEVTASARGSSVDIVVTDTGRGMSLDESRHAFDRFWRAPAAHVVPGHGIGLSLVQQIVEAHGGRVHIASVPGEGTTVTMTLPSA